MVKVELVSLDRRENVGLYDRKASLHTPCADSLPEAVDSEGRSTGVGHGRVGAVQTDGSPCEMTAVDPPDASAARKGEVMRGTRRSRWIIVMCRAACILLASLASACSPSDEASPRPNPTSPTLPTPPTPPASSGRLQMSGRVLDQNGTPLPGASSRSTTRPPEESAIRRLTVLWRASAGLRQERTTWASIQSSSTHEPGRNVDGHVNWVSSTLFTRASKSTSSGCRMAPLPRFGTCGSVPRAAFLLASRSSSRSTPRARSAQTSRISGSCRADAKSSSSSQGRACCMSRRARRLAAPLHRSSGIRRATMPASSRGPRLEPSQYRCEAGRIASWWGFQKAHRHSNSTSRRRCGSDPSIRQ